MSTDLNLRSDYIEAQFCSSETPAHWRMRLRLVYRLYNRWVCSPDTEISSKRYMLLYVIVQFSKKFGIYSRHTKTSPLCLIHQKNVFSKSSVEENTHSQRRRTLYLRVPCNGIAFIKKDHATAVMSWATSSAVQFIVDRKHSSQEVRSRCYSRCLFRLVRLSSKSAA